MVKRILIYSAYSIIRLKFGAHAEIYVPIIQHMYKNRMLNRNGECPGQMSKHVEDNLRKKKRIEQFMGIFDGLC